MDDRFGDAEGRAKEVERIGLVVEMDEEESYDDKDWPGGGAGTLGIGKFGGGPAGRALAAEERRREVASPH